MLPREAPARLNFRPESGGPSLDSLREAPAGLSTRMRAEEPWGLSTPPPKATGP